MNRLSQIIDWSGISWIYIYIHSIYPLIPKDAINTFNKLGENIFNYDFKFVDFKRKFSQLYKLNNFVINLVS